jgi:FADH2-dependent halogenase/halogenation protein CepH
VDVQVAVIGGGPAGSCTAAALARQGHQVALIESEPFPRFHIGESLLPFTNRVFARLGLMEAMAAAGFVRKCGASFLDQDGRRFVYDFGDQSGDPTAVTFQVPRADFDALLFAHAQAQGAAVIAARALAIRIGDQGVEVDTDQGTTVRARMLVDASGRAGLLARKFDLRRPDAHCRRSRPTRTTPACRATRAAAAATSGCCRSRTWAGCGSSPCRMG